MIPGVRFSGPSACLQGHLLLPDHAPAPVLNFHHPPCRGPFCSLWPRLSDDTLRIADLESGLIAERWMSPFVASEIRGHHLHELCV